MASRVYEVVIHAETMTVDEAATELARENIGKTRRLRGRVWEGDQK
jgi:hypothetical protein